ESRRYGRLENLRYELGKPENSEMRTHGKPFAACYPGLTESAMQLHSLRKSEMKSTTAVALIIMGTMLILAPIGADYLFQRNLVSLLMKESSISTTLMPQLSTWYRVVCWLTGSLMVLFGALVPGAYTRAGYYEVADDDDDEVKHDG
ncbi:MAG: hypothetical protein WCT12_31820, partial [Verrucomicrobiota bacterium]